MVRNYQRGLRVITPSTYQPVGCLPALGTQRMPGVGCWVGLPYRSLQPADFPRWEDRSPLSISRSWPFAFSVTWLTAPGQLQRKNNFHHQMYGPTWNDSTPEFLRFLIPLSHSAGNLSSWMFHSLEPLSTRLSECRFWETTLNLP